MFKNKKVMVLLLILLIGASVYYGYNKSSVASLKSQDMTKETTTTAYTVKSMSIGESIDTTGRVKAKKEADISSKIESDNIVLNVEIGDQVKAGDVLAVLDRSDIELQILSKNQQVLEAESNLSDLKKGGNLSYKNTYYNTKAIYENKKNTYDTNVILFEALSISEIELKNSKTDMDKAYNDYNYAKNRYEAFDLNSEIAILKSTLDIHNKNLELLQNNLEKASIIAPFDSIVTDVFVSNGDSVREDAQIMHLMDVSELIVELDVSEYEVYKVIEGQVVTISPYGNSEKIYKGIVNKIYPSGSADDDQSYVKVEIGVLKSDATLKPGFSVTLNIQISQKDKALVVPYDALIKTNKGYFLSKINEDGTSSKLLVETGIESDLFIEVLSDELKEGDNLLVMSQIDFSKAKDGLKLPGVTKLPRGGGSGGK